MLWRVSSRASEPEFLARIDNLAVRLIVSVQEGNDSILRREQK